MKIFHLGRFIVGADVAKDAFFDITQQTGVKYTLPLAIGWMRHLSKDDNEPLTAFTCFLGPISIAIGYVKS